MTLKRFILVFQILISLMWSRSSWSEEQANPSVAVASTATTYKTVNFKVPVYLNNPSAQVGGFEMSFGLDYGVVVDFTVNIDTVGTLVNKFDLLDVNVVGDSITGDYITIIGIADQDSTPPSGVIGPGNGLLYNLIVNITSNCLVRADTTLTTIQVDKLHSHLSKPNGELIDSVEFFDGSVYVPGLCVYGDANANGTVNLSDIIYLVNYVFKGSIPPCPEKAGDANKNNAVNLADIIFLVNHVFKGGPAPCPTG